MEPRLIWGNLISGDLDRTTKFYTDLGFKANGSPTEELTSIAFGQNNFIINFFVEKRLSEDSNGNLTSSANGKEIILSLSADSKEEVDLWVDKVKAAGATIFSQPALVGKGYSFGFADPDGHKFNFLYWPGM